MKAMSSRPSPLKSATVQAREVRRGSGAWQTFTAAEGALAVAVQHILLFEVDGQHDVAVAVAIEVAGGDAAVVIGEAAQPSRLAASAGTRRRRAPCRWPAVPTPLRDGGKTRSSIPSSSISSRTKFICHSPEVGRPVSWASKVNESTNGGGTISAP